MNRALYFFGFLFCIVAVQGVAQINPVIDVFPKGTVWLGNIPYNNEDLPKHLLDIYLPANDNGKLPLVVFVHGGGWLVNDKYVDIG